MSQRWKERKEAMEPYGMADWSVGASRLRVSAEGGYEERPEEVGMTSASCTRDWRMFLIDVGKNKLFGMRDELTKCLCVVRERY